MTTNLSDAGRLAYRELSTWRRTILDSGFQISRDDADALRAYRMLDGIVMGGGAPAAEAEALQVAAGAFERWAASGNEYCTVLARSIRARAAYDADCAARPTYDDGAPRKAWSDLGAVERWSWERNPTPRFA